MKIKLEYFGLILEAVEKENEVFECAEITLDGLTKLLIKKYPNLLEKPFVFAVNQQIENRDYLLKNDDVVALLPPFAGG